MPFPAGLGAFNHRDFRLFWSGQLVSLIGTWMQSVGQSWLVLELTNSPFKLGIVGTLQFAPMLFLLFVAGAIGSFLIGSISETLGVPAACAVGGGLGLLAVLALTIRWTRLRVPRS